MITFNQASSNRILSILASALVLAVASAVSTALAANILNVVETGGDNEATDTIQAKWTGETWDVSVANEPIPGAVGGETYTTGLFGSEAPAFVDRNHRYLDDGPNNLPILDYLIGQEYIMSGNDNRDNAAYRLDVTIGAASTVYMLIDNRLSDASNATPPTFDAAHMQWIVDEEWQPTTNGFNRSQDPALPDEVPIDEGADGGINQWYSVYKREFPAGTFSLLQADNTGQNMYGVVVVPAPIAGDPITSFVAQPSSMPPGGQAVLAWVINAGATSAAIDQGIGTVLPQTTGGIGNATVAPATDTTYTLSVASPPGNGTRTATVQVRPLAFLQASESLVNPGTSVTLSWRIRADATATLTGIGSVAPHTAANGTGSVVVSPASTTTYTLSSTASGRTEEASVTIVTRPSGTQFALIDLGGTQGRPEPGAISGMEIGAGVADLNVTDLPEVALVSDTGVPFTIAIDNLDPTGSAIGGLDWRDRGDGPTTALALVAEDHVKSNAGMVHVTLGGLPAGVYSVHSFHIDAANSQSEAIRILVTDATRVAEDTGVVGNASYPGHPANTGIPGVAGLTTGLVDQHTARFDITSDGLTPVSIWFDATTDPVDTEVPLAGLWLFRPPSKAYVPITQFTHNAAAGTSTMTFPSAQGSTYTVEATNSFLLWEKLTINLPGSAGATTDFTESGIPQATVGRFYRVFRN